MKYTKCFESCGTWFSEYNDGTTVACPYLERVAPEGSLENDFPFNLIWCGKDCDGWTLDDDWNDDLELERKGREKR